MRLPETVTKSIKSQNPNVPLDIRQEVPFQSNIFRAERASWAGPLRRKTNLMKRRIFLGAASAALALAASPLLAADVTTEP